MSVSELGLYTLLGYSSISMTIYLYENNFSPMFLDQNRVSITSGRDERANVVSKAKLPANNDYYVVVETTDTQKTGAFNLTISGPKKVSLSAIPGIHICHSFLIIVHLFH